MSIIEDSPLVAHARRELTLAGLFDEDSDYGGMLGEGCMALVEVFAKQGHSGMSAAMTTEIVARLMRFEPLTELTDDPGEWNHIAEEMAGQSDLWQSARKPSAFSNDGGKTWYETGGIDGIVMQTKHKE